MFGAAVRGAYVRGYTLLFCGMCAVWRAYSVAVVLIHWLFSHWLLFTSSMESVVLPLVLNKHTSKVYCSEDVWFYGPKGFRNKVRSINCPRDCECTLRCEYVHIGFIPTADI